jgi:hypothetical protein
MTEYTNTMRILDDCVVQLRVMLADFAPDQFAPRELTLFGLTLDEAKDWLGSEPDFAKRIVLPLNSKRPPDKLPVYLEGGIVCPPAYVGARCTGSQPVRFDFSKPNALGCFR